MGLFSKKITDKVALDEITSEIKAKLDELAEKVIILRKKNNMRKLYKYGKKDLVSYQNHNNFTVKLYGS